ncbi:cell wall metabolism sensor histidine kinase WalK [uncultured Clostridium sp.]|uniref:sensor histidine kinase n=1 Tax=uncultured Clostridium sp. TaxID=59620 RepID=UPI0025E69218|nr:HAMP domain-containing sensor histidine kinase [uncultured Clostridium sp.]
MDYKNKLKSINSKLIISFTLIMIVTIITIRFFVNTNFKNSFEKYVDDSNKVEINHLIEFDLKGIYSNDEWDMNLIENLGVDSIRKGITIEIYNKNDQKLWSVFEDEKVLSDTTLSEISKNIKSIEKKKDNYFKEFKVDINNDDGELVGYAYIGHYEFTYYMENDIQFFNAANKIIDIIGIISIGSIIIISIIISKSIANPILKVSKMAKLIGEGNYKKEVSYKSNIREIDDLISSINKLSNELKEQENLRKQLTEDIAHELRTPLTSIRGHLDTIIAGIWQPTNERLISINEEVIRITNLVDKLRKLAKFDKGKNNLNKEIVDLKKYIKSIAYNYEGKALEKNIIIKYKLEDIKALIDKEKFAQVIINILANAIKYNNGNNEIYIRSFKKDNNIVISIKDYGVGIAKSEQKNIFERFYRVDKSRGANEKGMGVGLTIAKSIVNAHGGEIKVYSEINKGSEFIITLPNEEQ